MARLEEAVGQFLAKRRIAVAGVSRNAGQPANAIYAKLRGAGYQVFAVNPRATEVEGSRCYARLSDIPDGVEAVVIATPPSAADDLVRECAGLGVSHVWMHRSFGGGSVSSSAVAFCRAQGMTVIAGACPMMYVAPDVGHRCMRWVLKMTGGLPRQT